MRSKPKSDREDTATFPPIAIVTNAESELGRAIAIGLAKRGIDSILCHHSDTAVLQPTLDAAQALGQKCATIRIEPADFLPLNVVQAAILNVLSTEWNRHSFNILITCATHQASARVDQVSGDDLDWLFHVHFKEVVLFTQILLPLMENGGSIVNVTSALTRFVFSGNAIFASMKGAVEVLTRYLATEVGQRGIRVNSIAAGPLEGGIATAVTDRYALGKRIQSTTALARPGAPEDVAAAIAALVSVGNEWLTGQRIEVSGGFTL